jgi:predicted unusual protein kinase regulating ubiquinone biosynthesis (AarF/ABC1/UbiB family)
LGQAHRAQLPNGDRVVVKVQRPGIRDIVRTDLAALAVVARWAMRLRFIRRRANVPALLDEFSAVLWEELDYSSEADNAEAFARMFADDKGVYIPRVCRDYSTRRVVTLEDVSAIKITDYAALEAAGVSRSDVARRLLHTYLTRVFIQRFYHADPHPGNLFIYPLDPDTPTRSGYPRDGPPLEGQPFYLIFVDFGMVGRVTPEIVAGLRETLIAFSTQDARRLVQSYQQLNILLPDADLDRIEAASRAVFDRVWGMSMAEITHIQMTEIVDLGREFKDLLLAMPFQLPQDFLYLGRCIGILSGLAIGLNPDFDPWAEVAPFAQTLLEESDIPIPPKFSLRDLTNPQTLRALLSSNNREWVAHALFEMGRRALRLPVLAEDALRRAERGDLTVQAAPSPAMERELRRLERVGNRLAAAVMFAGLAVSSAILYAAGEQTLGAVGFALAGVTLVRVLLVGR